MIYLIATSHFATAPDNDFAQLLVSAGYTIVDKAVFDAHVRQLEEPERPEPGEGPRKLSKWEGKEANDLS